MRFALHIFLLSGFVALSHGADIQPGSIVGRLQDAQTGEALAGAEISVLNSNLGAATDLNGEFTIGRISPGSYSVQFSYIGYNTVLLSDIIVRPARSTRLDFKLTPAILESESIQVTAGYFPDHAEKPVSVTGFSREEIRRAPGSAGDVSRIIMGLPALAKVNDQSNSLIVRGGSPVENAFYIDDIEIPNINHFPTQGSSGGPIGIINVDFVDNVEFYSGGFPARYGDRLSAIMNITLREGEREKLQGQADLNFAGFGGVLEGPWASGEGSWMLSARRSYLDMLVKLVDTGTSLAPRYGDIQTKLVYDADAANRLTIIGILADNHSRSDRDIAWTNAMLYYGSQDNYQGTFGLKWQTLWANSGYSQTVVSYNLMRYDDLAYQTTSGLLLTENHSTEHLIHLKNHNFYKINSSASLEFGAQIKQSVVDYNNYFAATLDPLGQPIPPMTIDLNNSATRYALYLNLIFRPLSRLTANLGLRADYFSATERFAMSPGISLAWQLTDRTSISAAVGIYQQNIPLNLMAQKNEYRNLADLRAIHFILGLANRITESTMFSMEMYYKDYSDFPLDPQQSGLFVMDELYYNYGFFTQHAQLNDQGRAYTYGVEIMLQKKLAEKIYGMLSASFFRAAYRSDDGVWRNRVYDNRFVFNAEGGYKPDNKWEFSLRWIFAGGIPYTPFDLVASEAINSGILDGEKINADRLPCYHSLNLRFDRRFLFSRSNIVLYVSIWNVYNRKNVASYYWDSRINQPGTIYQWGILPIFGIEYEF